MCGNLSDSISVLTRLTAPCPTHHFASKSQNGCSINDCQKMNSAIHYGHYLGSPEGCLEDMAYMMCLEWVWISQGREESWEEPPRQRGSWMKGHGEWCRVQGGVGVVGRGGWARRAGREGLCKWWWGVLNTRLRCLECFSFLKMVVEGNCRFWAG